MTPDSKNTVYLVDASGYIFRAYHAIRSRLTTIEGVPTNAVFGFTQMLIKLIDTEKPAYLVPVFDVSRVSFRTEIYPEYKANRSAPPEDLVPQFPLIRDVVEAFGLPAVELEGFEADDLIGTLAHKLRKEGYKVCIVTSDKDLMQLVDENIRLLDTWKEKSIGPEEVIERFGVEAGRVIDILGLAGDNSDNVPGVPGIGEKTAIALVREFGSLEAVLENVDKVKGAKRKENLRNFADQALLSKRLVMLDCNAPVDFDLENYRVGGFDEEKTRTLFEKLQFEQLLSRMGLSDGDTEKIDVANIDRDAYVLVDDEQALFSMIAELKTAQHIAFDTETRSFDALGEAPLVGMSFAIGEGRAFYVPVAHSIPDVRQIEKPRALKILGELFDDPAINWVMQNAKYDLTVMQSEGTRFAGRVDDTMLLSYSLNPAGRSHGLDAMALQHLGHGMISFEEVAGKGKNQVSFDRIDTQTACRYAAEDADVTLRLFNFLSPKLEQQGLTGLYEELERPLVPVLAKMERNGFKVDKAALEAMTEAFDKMLGKLAAQIYELAGEEFNINSPKKLGEILFDKLSLPKGRKTKGKTGYSTNVSVLTGLKSRHPLPGLVLDYRQTAKLRSTYSDALVKLIRPETGRVHSSFNQTVALSGRLSSSEPNLQNIPIRNEAGRMIRRAFIADEGRLLLAADYSQVELRILAHLSEDPILIDSFERDEDIHTRTAAEVFDTMAAFVDREMRRRAKAVNFGIIYGQTAYGLSETLGIPRGEAAKIINDYFSRYSGVRDFIEKTKQQAKKNGKATTLYGRQIPLADIDARNAAIRAYSERLAVNAPIQGSAADIIKRAMISIDRELTDGKFASRMLLQVHDELVFETYEDELDRLRELVIDKMEGAAELSVPLKVDIGVGKNWEEAH